MKKKTLLKGMTWNHTRGFVSVVATAQRYHELHSEVEIVWEKRSLKEFGEYPVHRLMDDYDLMVIDHPYTGFAARHQVFYPVSEGLSQDYLRDQKENSVGLSYPSYEWEGKLWALPIDAATPVAAWRPDLLQKNKLIPPQTWEELLDWCDRGWVDVVMEDINALMNFYGIIIAHGERPFASEGRICSPEVGALSLSTLKELVRRGDPEKNKHNPIESLNRLSSSENSTKIYSLFPYGYSNYSKRGYADHLLQFGDLPTFQGKPMVTTIGGTGMAISAKSKNLSMALDYARFTASEEIQRTLFTDVGGQPAHRKAWLDSENNRLSLDYFKKTLPVLDRSFLRPRYSGYDQFQEHAGPVINACLYDDINEKETVLKLEELYQKSLKELL